MFRLSKLAATNQSMFTAIIVCFLNEFVARYRLCCKMVAWTCRCMFWCIPCSCTFFNSFFYTLLRKAPKPAMYTKLRRWDAPNVVCMCVCLRWAHAFTCSIWSWCMLWFVYVFVCACVYVGGGGFVVVVAVVACTWFCVRTLISFTHVYRWIRDDFEKKEMALFPINEGSGTHWSLVIVWPKRGEIGYLPRIFFMLSICRDQFAISWRNMNLYSTLGADKLFHLISHRYFNGLGGYNSACTSRFELFLQQMGRYSQTLVFVTFCCCSHLLMMIDTQGQKNPAFQRKVDNQILHSSSHS